MWRNFRNIHTSWWIAELDTSCVNWWCRICRRMPKHNAEANYYDFFTTSIRNLTYQKKKSRQTLHVKRQKKSGDVTALFCVPSATEFDVNNTKKKIVFYLVMQSWKAGQYRYKILWFYFCFITTNKLGCDLVKTNIANKNTFDTPFRIWFSKYLCFQLVDKYTTLHGSQNLIANFSTISMNLKKFTYFY